MASDVQVDFTGGEFSQFVDARIDNDRYKTGMFLCRNYIPYLEGPVGRRPGTRFAHFQKHDDQHAILERFEFSTLQSYILEFGELYLRVFRDHEIVREDQDNPKPISSVVVGATTVFGTTGAHGFSNGDRAYITLAGGTGPGIPWTIINHREFIINDATATTFRVTDRDGNDIDSTGYQAFLLARVSRIFEAVSPYTADQVDALRFVQSADVLYITHPDMPPYSLARRGDDDWTFTELDILDGPYLITNVTPTTLTPSGTTGTITLTASSLVGINEQAPDGPGFLTTDVGRLIRFQDDATNWTWMEITIRNSATNVTVVVRGEPIANTNASLNWRLGLFSATFGYPRTATFHEQRVWFGGAGASPQRVSGTRTNGFSPTELDMTPTDPDGVVVDDHAVSATLDSDDVNAIFWMVSDEKGLLLGTQANEWVVRASTLDEPITPTSIQARKATAHGSADIAPVMVGKSAIFVQRAKRKIRELTYFYDVGGFQAPNLTLLAAHMTVGGAAELAFQREPNSIVWVRRADGVVLGMSYQREQDTIRVGWHQHRLGGQDTAADFYGAALNFQCKSIAVIPAPDGLRDELWMANVRTIGGVTRRTVEYMTPTFTDEDGDEDAYFMDMGRVTVTREGLEPIITTTEEVPLDGLHYLEGATLRTWIDGALGPDALVVNGELTFPTELISPVGVADKILWGFAYTSSAVMLRPEAGQQEGAALGKKQTIKALTVYFYRTSGIEFGRLTNLEFGDSNILGIPPMDPVIFRDVTFEFSDEPNPLFTGLYAIGVDSNWSTEERIAWRQTDPCPGTILSVTSFLETQDSAPAG